MKRARAIWLLLVLMACGRTPLDELPALKGATAPDAGPGTPGGTGGAPSTGGAPGTGGAPDTGGAPGTGGAPATGGAPGTGGSPPPDAAPDVAPDAPPPPPRVACPPGMTTRPRRDVHLQGLVRPATGWQASWTVVAAPSNSAVSRASVSGTSLDFVPDVTGDYSLRFQASDARGNSDSCQVAVSARALPPLVFCPRDTSVTVNAAVMLTGQAKDDDGPVTLRWSVSPATATLSPVDGFTTRFLAAQTGSYAVTLTATDIDGATSACTTSVQVLPAPLVMCPPSGGKFVRLREAIFQVNLDPSRVLSTRWFLIKRPAGSQAEPNPGNSLFTIVKPDQLGEYVLGFAARVSESVEIGCQTTFTAVSEPPSIDCSDIDTRPLTDTDVTATTSDNGEIVRWEWSLDSQPPGSAVRPMFPMGDTFTFKPDLAGDYKFTLKVTDDEALTASCSFAVHALAEEGLRVEMFWDTADTDMDLHLLSPVAKRWFDEDTNQDCFYSNCIDTPPNWSDPTTAADDPHLDIDDTDGFGPENINVDQPAAGVYRVGVHGYSGFAKQVTVRIYCGGSRLEPRATLGPIPLSESQVWKVADVEIFNDGRCQVKSLAQPDGSPTIVSRGQAEMSR
jgi:hypothetical protein